MSVNQVGGTHYKAKYQHWDYAAETGLGYLEGCASKYITRWRKKDGVEGLKKAISYLNKIKELGVTVSPPSIDRPKRSPHKLDHFINDNGFYGSREHFVFCLIDAWESHSDLDLAIAAIGDLINEGNSKP